MRSTPISLLAAGFLAAPHASAATTVAITTEVGNGADTYINTGNTTLRATNYGTSTIATAKLHSTGGYTTSTVNRKAYIRFDITGLNLAANPNATLKLSTAGSWSGTGTMQVYGLNNGNAGENWGESTITWNNAPGNTGTAVTSNTFDALTTILLGDFTQGSTADGTVINFSSAALNTFLSQDTDGLVTLMFLRTTASDSLNTSWATKEHATLTAPTLQFDTIPEPSVTLLGGLGVLGLLRRRRN